MYSNMYFFKPESNCVFFLLSAQNRIDEIGPPANQVEKLVKCEVTLDPLLTQICLIDLLFASRLSD